MNIAQKIADLAIPDRTIAITRAVAEEIECPEWIKRVNACDTPDHCFCRNAAERVAKIVSP